MVIPSQVRFARKGVETVRQVSIIHKRWIKRQSRPSNSKEAMKIVVVCITDWSLVQVQAPPPYTPDSDDILIALMTNQQKLISKKFLVYKMLTSMWFLGAVWLYFYRLFITDQQVGILDGTSFAIGLLAEVPSGAIADKIGRDKTVKIGQLAIALGLIYQAMSHHFPSLLVGQIIVMVGLALVSGADEALFFENLDFKRESKDWRKLVTRASQFALAGSVVALTIGGWLHTVNPRIPWFATAAAFIASVYVIWSVKDNRQHSKRNTFSNELRDYFSDIRDGFKAFWEPNLRLYVPIIITVQGLFYVNGYGLLRIILLDRFGFSPFWGAIAVATSSLVTVGILGYMHKNAETLSEIKVISVISAAALAALLMATANLGLWGYVVILTLYAGEHTLQPYMSEILNYHTTESRRATILSVGSFLRILPYVLLAPIIGYLSTKNKLEMFLVSWAILIGIALALYLVRKKSDNSIPLSSTPPDNPVF